MITIFKSGEVNYSDAGLNKPVRYTIDDLKRVASQTSTIDITNEHSNEVLGSLSNFIVKDGCLLAETPEGFDLKDKGLSPQFNTELIEYEDYYGISNITMESIGLTKKPRSKILYNSISTSLSSTEVDMGESALEKVIREKDDLQKRIGVMENSEKQYKRIIKQHEEELKKIKESYSDNEKLIAENKTLKEKADAYDALNEHKKQDLIKQIVGDDEKLAKEYESFSVENLETVLKSRKVSTPQRGVSPEDYPTDSGEDTPPEGDEDDYTDEMFEADFEASGL